VYKKEGKEIGRANCDNMIISALTKGPDRIRALSREELKIEIERLKNQILLFKTNKKEANQQQTEVGIRDEKNNVLNKSVISEQSSFENANE
jgi:predicted RNase H-like nuclease (RuvC/YqgF family)